MIQRIYQGSSFGYWATHTEFLCSPCKQVRRMPDDGCHIDEMWFYSNTPGEVFNGSIYYCYVCVHIPFVCSKHHKESMPTRLLKKKSHDGSSLVLFNTGLCCFYSFFHHSLNDMVGSFRGRLLLLLEAKRSCSSSV